MCSNEQADCRRSGTLEIIDSDRSRNTLSDGSNQERIRLRLAIIAATIFIVAGIALFYVPVAHDGLPIGWDTPHYIGGAIVLASEGPLALLSLQGPYNFIYQLLEGGLVWIGVPGTSLEVFLPVILAASIPYLLSRLVLEHLGTRTAILVTLATPGWYAVYRLQADLHANLLALTLFLSALILLSKARSVREPRCLYGLGLVALASITHIESTMFLMFVILVSSLTPLRPYPLKIALAVASTTVPAAIFYTAHLVQLLGFSGGSLDVTSSQTFESWLFILGPLLPLTIVGLVWCSLRPRSWLEIFAAVWGFTSIILGISQYVSLQTVIFSQRGILLMPGPLLAGIGVARVGQILPSLKVPRLRLRNAKIPTMVAIFTILTLSWPVTWATAVPNEKIFLTSTEYQQLEWISANLRFSSTPIFMFNDLNEFASGLAQLYDNWAAAIVGPHLSYLGLIDYLAQVQETPFSDTGAREVSGEFMQKIVAAGITSKTTLLQHPIIIIGEFYRPFPLPNYTLPLFTQVYPGVFLDNASRLESLSNVTLPLYITFAAHSGAWYGVQRSWTKSVNAYEVYDDSVPMDIEASFELGIQSSGTYTMGLRYWDGSANNLTISVDGNTIGTIAYYNTKSPVVDNFTGISFSKGIHLLKIAINDAPPILKGGLAYASLDYLVLTRS
ncbi:MAG: hypothetical protein AUF79_02435 [Crenarchaeota archaeon 13_1_20CM_2_51_8]|nr:MAG: hypothetical protein AUF79_02435 [Crenarchaeota archaeon 13_1_20CM_2_51_8]